jgi:polysaccharide biosynthesis transport protein
MIDRDEFQSIDSPIISIHDIIGILRFYWRLILFIVILTITSSIIVYYRTLPNFLSSTKILVEKNSNTENIFQFNNDNEKFIDNEIAIIKSRELAKSVVEELWHSDIGHNQKSVFFGTKEYKRRGYDWIQSVKNIRFLKFFSNKNNQNLKAKHEYNMDEKTILKYALKLQGNMRVSHQRGTKILNLTFQSPSAYESTYIVNLIVNVYKQFDTDWSKNQSNLLIQFLTNQISDAYLDLEKIELELKKFKKKHGLFLLNAGSELLINQFFNISNEIDNIQLSLNINEKEIAYLRELLSREESNILKDLGEFNNSKLIALRTQISNFEVDYIKNSSLYGEDFLAVDAIKTKIDELKEKLNIELEIYIDNNITGLDPLTYREDLIAKTLRIETELFSLNTKKYEYGKLFDDVQLKVNQLPDEQMEFVILNREQKVLSETYSLMRQKIEEAKIASASISDKIRVVDYAIKPNSPIAPILNEYLLYGILSGLLISGLFVYARESLDRSVKSLDFVEKFGHPLLAIIPDMKPEFKKDIDQQRKIILIDEPRSPIAEAYRGLRTKLLYTKSDVNTNKKVILVSSPGPGEGKTTTIVNLGIAFSSLGNKTLLIDADLRKPVIHKIFDKSSKKGLTNYLFSKEDPITDYIEKTEIENFDIICSGPIPPNPSEIIDSVKMKTLIIELLDEYDTVLIDAPPLLAVTDAFVLMNLVNQFILVVRPGKTNKEGLARSIKDISKSRVNFTGVIFNGASKLNSYGMDYYYDNYYYQNDEA